MGCGALASTTLRNSPPPWFRNANHRFVFLGHEADQILPAVAVDIHGRDVECAARLQQEFPLEFSGAIVLEPEHRARVVAAELGHRDIQITVAIEVQGASIRHPMQISLQQFPVEGAGGILSQQVDLPSQRADGRHDPQVGDDDVQVAVRIEIDDLRMNRNGDVRERLFFPLLSGLLEQLQFSLFAIADQELLRALGPEAVWPRR